MTRVNIIRESTFFFYNQRVNYFVFIIRESTIFFFIIRESTIYALLPVCFPFLCWVKLCSDCFRQGFFSLGRQKKVVAGHVTQVVVLYSKDCVGI